MIGRRGDDLVRAAARRVGPGLVTVQTIVE